MTEKCGFCGEQLAPLERHVGSHACISEYKKRIKALEKELSEAKAEISRLKAKHEPEEGEKK